MVSVPVQALASQLVALAPALVTVRRSDSVLMTSLSATRPWHREMCTFVDPE
jgi:hypothetical protein